MPFNPYKFRVPANRDIRKLSEKFETMKQMKGERKIRIAAWKRTGGGKLGAIDA
jgi:hypothetical protein